MAADRPEVAAAMTVPQLLAYCEHRPALYSPESYHHGTAMSGERMSEMPGRVDETPAIMEALNAHYEATGKKEMTVNELQRWMGKI